MHPVQLIGSSLVFVVVAAGSRAGDIVIDTILLEGDNVPGVGLVTRIDNIAINDAGLTLVEADTNHSNTDADTVLLRDGVLYLREGQSLNAPVDATLDSFDSITINNQGDGGHNFFLDGTKNIFDDSGIYWNDVLVYQESEEAPGLTEGTPFIGFFDVKINNANQLLVMASVDDPNIPTSVDRALYVFNLDDAGAVTGFTLIAKEGDILNGQVTGVTDFGTGPHESAFNDSGDVLFIVSVDGDSSEDAVYLNDTLLANVGDDSPVKGRTWQSLSGSELDLSNNGDHVYSGRLSGDTTTDTLIVRNGEKFRQEGDGFNGFGKSFAFTSFGTGPLEISDGGDVLWYGKWNNPDTDVDEGLFLGDTMLVQEGVTMIDGVVIDTLRGVEDGYHMSDDGRFVIFEAILVNGNEGAFRIELPAAGVLAEITDFQVVFGSHLGGGLAELGTSDDQFLTTRSKRGLTAFEPNVMELVLGMNTGVPSPSVMNVAVESRMNNPGGIAKIRFKNFNSGAFEEVAIYDVLQVDDTEMIPGIDAANRVDGDGSIEMSVKHVVIAVFSAAGFDSFFDLVGNTVE